MVPVVRNAELLSFSGIEKEIGRLAVKARDGKITVDDMTGGTFTISNGGVFGSMLSTPIINPPEVAILGLSKPFDNLYLDNKKVINKKLLPVSLSYDHRVINGAYAARFVSELSKQLNQIQSLKESFNGS